MVNISDVRSSNAALKQSTRDSHTVAVFVGATSGIGLGTLKQFAKNIQGGRAYIVGRSKSAFKPHLDELMVTNPKGTFHFIETQISLIRNVDEACEEIKSREKKVDILFMTPASMNFGAKMGMLFIPSISAGPQNLTGPESAEGLDIPHVLRYYARLRFVFNLLPLLEESPSARVISILAGGRETEIDTTDLEVRHNWTFNKSFKQSIVQTTLAFELLAESHPSISFIHKYPGFVNTGVIGQFLDSLKGYLAIPATIFKWIFLPIANLFATTMDEAGERGLFLSTSARYPASHPRLNFVEVPLPEGVEVAESSTLADGVCNGVYRLNPKDDSSPESAVLVGYRSDSLGKAIWEVTQNVWDRAIAVSV